MQQDPVSSTDGKQSGLFLSIGVEVLFVCNRIRLKNTEVPRGTCRIETPDEVEMCFLPVELNLAELSSSKYANFAGVSSKSAVAIRQELITEVLLKERFLTTRPLGPNAIVLELAPKGRIRLGLHEPLDAIRS